jgi:hypothetical protein
MTRTLEPYSVETVKQLASIVDKLYQDFGNLDVREKICSVLRQLKYVHDHMEYARIHNKQEHIELLQGSESKLFSLVESLVGEWEKSDFSKREMEMIRILIDSTMRKNEDRRIIDLLEEIVMISKDSSRRLNVAILVSDFDKIYRTLLARARDCQKILKKVEEHEEITESEKEAVTVAANIFDYLHSLSEVRDLQSVLRFKMPAWLKRIHEYIDQHEKVGKIVELMWNDKFSMICKLFEIITQ